MFISLALIAALQSAPVRLQDFAHTTVVTYPVEGADPNAVRRAINAGRPTGPDGTARHDALTAWNWQTSWRVRPDGRCDPASAEVEMTITVTLPELTAPARLSRGERQSWDRYITALTHHEANHVRLALAGREALLTAMRGAPDCETMQAAAQHVADQIRDANIAYDRETRHGRTEGAIYPN